MQAMAGTMWALGAANKAPAVSWWLSGGVSASNAIAAYAPKGAASLAASYTNLANPGTYDAAPGTAPTWDAVNGWKFAAALLQYLTTGIGATTGNWTAIIKFSNLLNGVDGKYLFGHSGFGIRPAGTPDTHAYINNGTLSVAGNLTSGVLAVGTAGYKDGTSEGALTGTAARANTVHIGAINTGSPVLHITAYVQAFALYNTTITAAQVLSITTAMNLL